MITWLCIAGLMGIAYTAACKSAVTAGYSFKAFCYQLTGVSAAIGAMYIFAQHLQHQ